MIVKNKIEEISFGLQQAIISRFMRDCIQHAETAVHRYDEVDISKLPIQAKGDLNHWKKVVQSLKWAAAINRSRKS